jgi:hypothetical protein
MTHYGTAMRKTREAGRQSSRLKPDYPASARKHAPAEISFPHFLS